MNQCAVVHFSQCPTLQWQYIQLQYKCVVTQSNTLVQLACSQDLPLQLQLSVPDHNIYMHVMVSEPVKGDMCLSVW